MSSTESSPRRARMLREVKLRLPRLSRRAQCPRTGPSLTTKPTLEVWTTTDVSLSRSPRRCRRFSRWNVLTRTASIPRMTESSLLPLLLLLAYSAVLVGLGLAVGRRVRTTRSFFVADRDLGPGLLFVTLLAANIGAGFHRRRRRTRFSGRPQRLVVGGLRRPRHPAARLLGRTSDVAPRRRP